MNEYSLLGEGVGESSEGGMYLLTYWKLARWPARASNRSAKRFLSRNILNEDCIATKKKSYHRNKFEKIFCLKILVAQFLAWKLHSDKEKKAFRITETNLRK